MGQGGGEAAPVGAPSCAIVRAPLRARAISRPHTFTKQQTPTDKKKGTMRLHVVALFLAVIIGVGSTADVRAFSSGVGEGVAGVWPTAVPLTSHTSPTPTPKHRPPRISSPTSRWLACFPNSMAWKRANRARSAPPDRRRRRTVRLWTLILRHRGLAGVWTCKQV